MCHPTQVTFLPISVKLILDLETLDGCRLSWCSWLFIISRWYAHLKMVAHPSTDQSRHRMTSLIHWMTCEPMCCVACSDHRDVAKHSQPAWSRERRQLEVASVDIVQDWRRRQGSLFCCCGSHCRRQWGRGSARWVDGSNFLTVYCLCCTLCPKKQDAQLLVINLANLNQFSLPPKYDQKLPVFFLVGVCVNHVSLVCNYYYFVIASVELVDVEFTLNKQQHCQWCCWVTPLLSVLWHCRLGISKST